MHYLSQRKMFSDNQCNLLGAWCVLGTALYSPKVSPSPHYIAQGILLSVMQQPTWVEGLGENQSVQFSCSVVSNSLQPQGGKSVQFISVAQSCLTLCDPMNRSTPGLPVHHQHPESTQTHVHRISDAIQPSHPLLSPFPPDLNLSQHQGLLKWVSSSHQVAKVLDFELQHQSFQWTPRADLS